MTRDKFHDNDIDEQQPESVQISRNGQTAYKQAVYCDSVRSIQGMRADSQSYMAAGSNEVSCSQSSCDKGTSSQGSCRHSTSGLEPKPCYIAIDLKSYYASVECTARKLDPLGVNLVVADITRTDKTICLAVSPSLKAYGISGRARLFEVVQRVREINAARLAEAVRQHCAVWHDSRPDFKGSSYDDAALKADLGLKLDYITAQPRMALYVETSAKIYGIYLRYVSQDDIVVYSIDEVFINAAPYLDIYRMSARELAMQMIRDILKETGITATAGIGTNLYLAKLAMDIVAKHIPADKDGVRIAELDELSFRRKLWNHKPLTAFWMTGAGTAARLDAHGISTMGELARASLKDQEWFYANFGVDAEILIDHAWGLEPCSIKEIKRYRPDSKSISEGQVLARPYSYEEAGLIVREMADAAVMRLTERCAVAGNVSIDIGYDRENCDTGGYQGSIHSDHYGRMVPKGAHKSMKIEPTCLGSRIIPVIIAMFEDITDSRLTIRRINISLNNLHHDDGTYQTDIFSDTESVDREKRLQHAMLSIRRRFGKNAVLKGTSYEDGATMRERNMQIGGHRA